MTPAEQVRVFGQVCCWRQSARHRQNADMEINGIPIGSAAGVVAEAAVEIPTRQHPVRSPLDGLFARWILAAKMFQHEDRIEASVTITGQRIEHPAAVGFLIAQRPS